MKFLQRVLNIGFDIKGSIEEEKVEFKVYHSRKYLEELFRRGIF